MKCTESKQTRSEHRTTVTVSRCEERTLGTRVRGEKTLSPRCLIIRLRDETGTDGSPGWRAEGKIECAAVRCPHNPCTISIARAWQCNMEALQLSRRAGYQWLW